MNEATKKKISAKLKGRPKAARTKWLIKEALKGRILTSKHKENIAESMRLYYRKKKEKRE